MGIDLQGIARLVGVADGGTTGTSATGASTLAGATGFVTTVKRTGEIAPFETVIRKASVEQARAAPSLDAAPGAGNFRVKNADKARKSFEAFALQVFISSMLPKENEKLFGTGSAGKLWQSLMAEKLADQIASSGRLKLLPDPPSTSATADPPAQGSKSEPNGEAR